MGTAPPGFNYAHYEGIHSVAAAAIFTALYAVASAVWTVEAIRRRTNVHFLMTLFCAIRIAAFVTRTVLAASGTAAENETLLIVNEVFFGVGFFSLIYSAYTLGLDREKAFDLTPSGVLHKLFRNRILFHITVSTTIGLGVTGIVISTSSTDSGSASTGHLLRKISTIVFVGLTFLVLFQAQMLWFREKRQAPAYKTANDSFGITYGAYILIAVSSFLLVREIFLVATISNPAQQNNERLWYPLAVLPEFIVVCLLVIPDIRPPEGDLPTTKYGSLEMVGQQL